MNEAEPLVRWDWIQSHLGLFGDLTVEHLKLSLLPVLLGLVVAVPLGVLCVRWGWLYPPVLTIANILYAVPSLALFLVLLDFTGLTIWTVVIPLTLYTLSVLVPNVVDGLRQVPDSTRQAAIAMGYTPLRRLLAVELPIAVPVIMAGVRVATVANISLVSVGALIGIGGLGRLFKDGFDLQFTTPVFAGIVLIIALAVVFDFALVLLQRLLTPWAAR
ncbi:osmoprotectant transport system permease protein [Actinocorallia herbida]|uniref:Osmoprotectant transport system permease protein n=1 Tax=Actinocorallia herbida TaxID=58109 RepID=A0A3N1CPL7_9ACTN|nr:ABC transporter permease subunit [Actinocorallia herbida]ROO83250.1 osmoprotectant transport system permease protein [Actinocorallia herbida]